MKSLFLTEIKRPEMLSSALASILPGQQDPWLLINESGDPVAYFHIDPNNLTEIQADISGRYYNQNEAVADVLQRVADIVGGRVIDDEEAEQDAT